MLCVSVALCVVCCLLCVVCCLGCVVNAGVRRFWRCLVKNRTLTLGVGEKSTSKLSPLSLSLSIVQPINQQIYQYNNIYIYLCILLTCICAGIYIYIYVLVPNAGLRTLEEVLLVMLAGDKYASLSLRRPHACVYIYIYLDELVPKFRNKRLYHREGTRT